MSIKKMMNVLYNTLDMGRIFEVEKIKDLSEVNPVYYMSEEWLREKGYLTDDVVIVLTTLNTILRSEFGEDKIIKEEDNIKECFVDQTGSVCWDDNIVKVFKPNYYTLTLFILNNMYNIYKFSYEYREDYPNMYAQNP